MSVKSKTKTLNLITYINEMQIPTFLGEMSENMQIIDSTYSAIYNLIQNILERLENAEETLEDISVESIEDYKIRLTALEKKVNINVNSINSIVTQISKINSQINAINSEQQTQNGRLDSLDNLTANHTNRINTLVTDLVNVTDRIEILETCCENINHEITDLQRNVDGFNDDITILAGQIENINLTVDNLINTIDAYNLDSLILKVDALETKIGNADISSIDSTISGAIVELERQIQLLNPASIEGILIRLSTLETQMTTKVTQSDIDSSIANAMTNNELGQYTYIKSDT